MRTFSIRRRGCQPWPRRNGHSWRGPFGAPLLCRAMRTFSIFAALIVAAAPAFCAESPCDNCSGSGLLNGKTVSVPCPVCEGYGKRTTAGTAGAATTPTVKTEAPPALDEASLPADQQPTPWPGVDAGLMALNPKADEVIVDFGCGSDARWLIRAVSVWGTKKAVGVEIEPLVAESARWHVKKAGLSQQIKIITGDAITTDVQADIGVAYQFPDVLEKLKPQIAKLKRFVSYGHSVPGLTMRRSGDIFVYARPLARVVVQGTRPAQVLNYRPAAAVWGGRQYSGPVCSSRSCSMCQSLRRQLGWR